MTVKVQLKPEVEAELLAEAREKGLSLEAYLAQVLQERTRVRTPSSASAAARAHAFETWAHSRPISSPLSDQAVRRESLVRDVQ